jgi:hypothetical protein
MSAALLREVLADKEAFVRATEEAGLIATKVFSGTFTEVKSVDPSTHVIVVTAEKAEATVAKEEGK